MAQDLTTLSETLRSSLDGTEFVRLATTGTNWKAQLGNQNWLFGSVETATLIGGRLASSTLTLESTSGAGTSDFINFKTGSQVERMRIDTAGHVLINQTGANFGNIAGDTFQIIQPNTQTQSVGLYAFGTANNQATLTFYYTNTNTGPGTQVAVTSGQQLGLIEFTGSDSAAFRHAAQITAFADATFTAGSSPGRLSFLTAASGGTATTERLRIDSVASMMFYIAGVGPVASQAGHGFEQHSLTSQNSINLFTWSNDTVNLPVFRGRRSKSGTVGTIAGASSANELLIRIIGTGNDGSAFQDAGSVDIAADVAATSGHVPGRMSLTTSTSTTGLVEQVRIDSTGAVFLIGVTTTGSAANAFINNASSPVNSILRSTSSLRYKTDVTRVPQARIDALRALQPIEFTSTSIADNPDHRFVGYAAEDVAKIDPVLVHWGYDESDFDVVVHDHGDAGKRHERVVRPGAELKPDGVQYDRVLLLLVADLKQRVAQLEMRA